MSFTHPHPPLVPPQHYWDIYQSVDPELPVYGDWIPDDWRDVASSSGGNSYSACFRLQTQREGWNVRTESAVRTALRGFYALCTHIDHSIRLVLGTLREEGILDNTIILFTADHGDMLGRHGLWAKRLYYEPSANVPMLLVGPKGDSRIDEGSRDSRLTGLQDIMPTLLDLAGLEVPESCDGLPMAGTKTREHAYGECNEGAMATRMIHDGRYKLIYYPTGNVRQLFDLESDPQELKNLVADDAHAEVLARLTETLCSELYDSDLDWLHESGELVGLPDEGDVASGQRGLALQRGVHWPPAPVTPPQIGETNPGTN